MNKSSLDSEKQYNLEGCKVLVQFELKLVRIKGSKELLNYLTVDIDKHTHAFVRVLKADYLILMGRPIKITDASLMVEIWGHLYASHFAGALRELVDLKIVADFTERVKSRSDTIDCGEIESDSNRTFWDQLAKFKSIIIRFLP